MNMEFKISKKALEQDVKVLAKVINKKNALPILADILFEVKNDTLILTASNGEVWVTSQLHLDKNEGIDGKFAVGAEELKNSLSLTPEQPITISADTVEGHCYVKHQKGEFYFPVDAGDEYPLPHTTEAITSEKFVEAARVKGAIARALPVTADDVTRPILNGVCLDFTKEKLNVVASNGHQIIMTHIAACKSEVPATLVLPKLVCNMLLAMLEDDGEARFVFDDNVCVVTYGDTQVSFRLLTGKYPNYMSVFPGTSEADAVVNTNLLLGAVKSVSPFSSDSSNMITMSFDVDKVDIQGDDLDFSKGATYSVPIELSGKPINIGMKASLLAVILSKMDSTEVRILMNDPTRAVVIRQEDTECKDEIVGLCMPMLLNN